MQSPAGGLCGVPYHSLNCASTAHRYNSVGLNYIPYTKMCDVTKHCTRPHWRQIQVRGIGKMCLVQCIIIDFDYQKKQVTVLCISDLHFLLLLLIQCKISLYLGPVRCFVTPPNV